LSRPAQRVAGWIAQRPFQRLRWPGWGRIIVASTLCIYFGLLALLGGHSAWHFLGVPQLSLPFGDTRFITSAWQCIHEHVRVRVSNPCDPWQRRVDYPAIWLVLAALGLGESSTTLLGVVLAIGFLVCAIAVLPRGATSREAVVYGAALCSPALMLGVERGNTDLLAFVLVVAAVAAVRQRGWRLPLGLGTLLLAAVLKLFPIVVLPAVCRRTRPNVVAAAIVAGACAVYVTVMRHDLIRVAKAVPVRTGYSYGIDLPKLAVVSVPAALAVLALLTVGFVVAERISGHVPWVRGAPVTDRLRFFWVGSSVFVVTFVLIRSFDYRMVFLLLALPQLCEWARRKSVFARVTLFAILAAMWVAGVTLVATILQAVVFVSLLGAILATAPDGLLALLPLRLPRVLRRLADT
jgi:hypothetical protein